MFLFGIGLLIKSFIALISTLTYVVLPKAYNDIIYPRQIEHRYGMLRTIYLIIKNVWGGGGFAGNLNYAVKYKKTKTY